ncbi:hypothetical protein QVD17_19761 [Tagetes erecta]|uniref:Uncharacterized protein n=1 Tax=Tagetes erecta TaxID=13708 RepID=A0AAD8KK63_TARER|nr:hypothetical protein QVD17_19761 [Tagetes erecta]
MILYYGFFKYGIDSTFCCHINLKGMVPYDEVSFNICRIIGSTGNEFVLNNLQRGAEDWYCRKIFDYLVLIFNIRLPPKGV